MLLLLQGDVKLKPPWNHLDPEDRVVGGLLLSTFLGHARKVLSCRATPGRIAVYASACQEYVQHWGHHSQTCPHTGQEAHSENQM